MTVAEVESLLKSDFKPVDRKYPWANDDLVPGVVLADAMERFQKGDDWFWCAPRLFYEDHLQMAVGSACFKGSPVDGEVEIGYGVSADHEKRGIATAGVAALVRQAFSRDQITKIKAETASDNIASQRVLQKNGFIDHGTRVDPEDGLLVVWFRERTPAES